jgi:BirA family biotin operon repressor/biotin-[acetyl-CoA-carboxylase] ligase
MSHSAEVRLRAALAARGLSWSAPLEHHESLGSTSDRLRERAREGAPEWTVVVADRQLAGRGRHGRRWVSPPGGLYLSVLLRPPRAALSLVPLAAGLAVAEAGAEWGLATELKWPNDVLAGGRKLAGVLAEASSSVSGVEWVVLGIGVNLDEALPEALRGRATSVRAETGRRVATEQAAAAVLGRLRVWYDALRVGPDTIVASWRRRAVPWWGSLVEARSGAVVLRGRLEDVDETGALVLDVEERGPVRVVAGEVEQLRPLTRREP